MFHVKERVNITTKFKKSVQEAKSCVMYDEHKARTYLLPQAPKICDTVEIRKNLKKRGTVHRISMDLRRQLN